VDLEQIEEEPAALPALFHLQLVEQGLVAEAEREEVQHHAQLEVVFGLLEEVAQTRLIQGLVAFPPHGFHEPGPDISCEGLSAPL
jgi:hypothetical protein